jgi:hypothetical protein
MHTEVFTVGWAPQFICRCNKHKRNSRTHFFLAETEMHSVPLDSSEDYEECLNIIASGTSSVMEHILPSLILTVGSKYQKTELLLFQFSTS